MSQVRQKVRQNFRTQIRIGNANLILLTFMVKYETSSMNLANVDKFSVAMFLNLTNDLT